MVTIDGCKLLVDHGEAQGVGVTKLPKVRELDALPTELASMAERGLALGTGVTADTHICGVAARALLIVACARPLQQPLAQVGLIAGVDTIHPECARTRSKRTVLHSFTLQ